MAAAVVIALEFHECEACAVKPPAAPLCLGCAHNAAVIDAFLAATDPRLNGARNRALSILGKLPRDFPGAAR